MKQVHRARYWIPFEILAVLLLISLACGESATITSSPQATQTLINIPSTASAFPTNTPQPTNTPLPTNTPEPTTTREPYFYLADVSPYFFVDYDTNSGHGHGIKVYMGERKVFIFEIIGGGDCPSLPSGQGYVVRYPDKVDVYWKDRRAMENFNLFVANDATLAFHDWKAYHNCH